jgi:hypothetical protein
MVLARAALAEGGGCGQRRVDTHDSGPGAVLPGASDGGGACHARAHIDFRQRHPPPQVVECPARPNAHSLPMHLFKLKYWILAGMLLPLVLLVLALVYPDGPDYRVLERGNGFELRQYAPLRVAETTVTGTLAEAEDAAYPPLLDYIRGHNATTRKVPMLAPVMQQRVERDGAEGWLVQFVMPVEYPMGMLPPPANADVGLRQLPERQVAARRFGGGWAAERWQSEAGALLYAVEQAGLAPVGEPVFARYNAPFIPGFLRRNEVLVDVER